MARVMIALFEGFVLQKCREPELDVDGYSNAVRFIWSRLQASPKRISRGRS